MDQATLDQINGQSICPPDAGPAWRAAYEYGFDMALIEETLRLTPEERLEKHQLALDMILEIQKGHGNHAAER